MTVTGGKASQSTVWSDTAQRGSARATETTWITQQNVATAIAIRIDVSIPERMHQFYYINATVLKHINVTKWRRESCIQTAFPVGEAQMDDGVASKFKRRVRTIFLSDLHLGTRGCQADTVLDFLKVFDADEIYLVGDIVDGWRLRQAWHWPQAHNDVVQKLLRKARKGTRIVFIPGNHDEFLRDYAGSTFGGVEIAEEAIHICADGRKMLIIHGDKFDTVVRNVRWLALLGDQAYDLAIWLNGKIARLRRQMGLPYWSFSQWSKDKVKSAVSFITAFEEAVVNDAKKHSADIVLCGHIHKATIRQYGAITYINSGDWIESCTAILEHHDGKLEICHWHSITNVFELDMRETTQQEVHA